MGASATVNGEALSGRRELKDGDVITLNEVFTFEYLGDDPQGKIFGRWVSPGLRPGFAERLSFFGLLDAWLRATQDGA